jgi:hypothetical protein
MESWKLPDEIKVLEAVSALYDGRLRVDRKNGQATCQSSDNQRQYTVKFDLSRKAITSDDNSAHWQGRLGYPAIAALIQQKVLPDNSKIGQGLIGIPWRELNQRYKNNYKKTFAVVLEIAKGRGLSEKEIHDYQKTVIEAIRQKDFKKIKQLR